MIRLLFDINVMLDILLDREPHVKASAAAFAAVESGIAEGLLAAHAVTTIHYLLRRQMSAVKTRRTLAQILSICGIATVDSTVITQALELSCPDFEDAVTAAAARLANCDYIVTRDPRGFQGSPIRPLTPEGVLPLLSEG